tara:strand:+ start:432 stop:818 length:387 start_codon:yes stop_codon:yes gene_type:complete
MKLTKNFNKSEFESKDGSEMPNEVFYNIQKVANQLQILRNYLGRSIRVNSAYRSPKHNASIGGVKNSQHVLGKASDIVVAGLTTTEVYKVIEELIDKGDMLQGGLGLYNSFVHYDIRGSRARWDNTTK